MLLENFESFLLNFGTELGLSNQSLFLYLTLRWRSGGFCDLGIVHEITHEDSQDSILFLIDVSLLCILCSDLDLQLSPS